jgi:hypothetical protein
LGGVTEDLVLGLVFSEDNEDQIKMNNSTCHEFELSKTKEDDENILLRQRSADGDIALLRFLSTTYCILLS